LETRQEILDRVLELQRLTGRVLINEDELGRIRRIWAEDVLAATAVTA